VWHELDKKVVDRIVQKYGINVDSTERVVLKKAKVGQKTRVFRVEREGLSVFIVDTPMARNIACFPHLVGEPLEDVARAAAMEAFPVMIELADIRRDDSGRAVVLEQILRAAPGYGLQDVASRFLKQAYRTVYVRPRYTHKSYRDHDGLVQREIKLVHEDFAEFPRNKKVTLVMQDTVASGRSGEVSIEVALRHCEETGCEIEKWILYGFIAEHGLTVLHEVAKKHGIPLFAFPMGNLTALAVNNYDMPLYGVDEACWQKIHMVQKLGGTIDRVSLEEYIPCFVPGADQPGDWSARQSRLFNGEAYESGDIVKHLNDSVRLIRSLCEIGNFDPWQQRIANEELEQLTEMLAVKHILPLKRRP